MQDIQPKRTGRQLHGLDPRRCIASILRACGSGQAKDHPFLRLLRRIVEHHSFGRRGERLAARFLERRGYHILKMNWRCRKGEIDIIAIRDRTLVFVEVKTRTWREMQAFDSQEAVDFAKRARLRRLADWYIHTRKREIKSLRIQGFRFDTVGIYSGNIFLFGAAVDHIVDAIGLD